MFLYKWKMILQVSPWSIKETNQNDILSTNVNILQTYGR